MPEEAAPAAPGPPFPAEEGEGEDAEVAAAGARRPAILDEVAEGDAAGGRLAETGDRDGVLPPEIRVGTRHIVGIDIEQEGGEIADLGGVGADLGALSVRAE